jgi:acylpyruvate hydrolase
MRLATLRTPHGTRAVRVEDTTAIELDAPDVGTLLTQRDWAAAAAARDGARHTLNHADLAPVVPQPGKIICVGLNYRNHIREMGRELPDHPTLFAKFPESLVGAADPIMLDPLSDAVDWEAELAVVIGARVRRTDESAAETAVAGFSVLNDVTMRDWQYRSPQWLQGKTFESTSPFGPVLVTPDELPGGVRPRLQLRASIDGETVQSANTGDLLFDPVALVRYISAILNLNPGDVIATGTPGGVGHARTPARYLTNGATLVTEIDGIGRLENVARDVVVPA